MVFLGLGNDLPHINTGSNIRACAHTRAYTATSAASRHADHAAGTKLLT